MHFFYVMCIYRHCQAYINILLDTTNISCYWYFFPFPTLYYIYEQNISPCGPLGPPTSQDFS